MRNYEKKPGGTHEHTFGSGLAGVHAKRVPIFRVFILKTAWTLDAAQVQAPTGLRDACCGRR